MLGIHEQNKKYIGGAASPAYRICIIIYSKLFSCVEGNKNKFDVSSFIVIMVIFFKGIFQYRVGYYEKLRSRLNNIILYLLFGFNGSSQVGNGIST